jgi:hypothetical protein
MYICAIIALMESNIFAPQNQMMLKQPNQPLELAQPDGQGTGEAFDAGLQNMHNLAKGNEKLSGIITAEMIADLAVRRSITMEQQAMQQFEYDRQARMQAEGHDPDGDSQPATVIAFPARKAETARPSLFAGSRDKAA